MWHKATLKDIVLNENSSPAYYEDVCGIKNMQETKINIHKNFMTGKELKKYSKGKDLYFTFKRLVEIFPDAKIIGGNFKK